MAEVKFEDAMKRIEKIVGDLESGDLPLEESIERFEEAIKLAKSCQARLEKAEERVSKLVKSEDGFALEPLDEKRED
jgi:exodeoxyribonuclease VII small subunit